MVYWFNNGMFYISLYDKEELTLEVKNKRCCPKCCSENIVRIPDSINRYSSGNNIYTTKMTLSGKIPVIRYVCCDCGFVENWIEKDYELDKIKKKFG